MGENLLAIKHGKIGDGYSMVSNNCAGRTVLLTAFEPFAGDEINPSWEAAHPLNGWRYCNARIQVAKLPCVFGRAVAEMEAAINLYQPSLIIGTGLARDIDDFRLERVAVNIIDATIPDNIGQQPRDQHITQDGAAAYFSSLPLRKIEAALQSDQIPVSISYSAGTYVGNHVFYALMRHLERLGNLDKVPAGFIHLPYLPQQAALIPHSPPKHEAGNDDPWPRHDDTNLFEVHVSLIPPLNSCYQRYL